MIVVVIVGLLAALAMPAFQKARIRTQNTRLANDLRLFKGAFESYNLEFGAWPPDLGQGTLPPEMVGYIVADKFEVTTVVGGEYDWEGPGVFSFTGVSLRDTHLTNEQAIALDELMDDGDLGTGNFQFRDGVYAAVFEFN